LISFLEAVKEISAFIGHRIVSFLSFFLSPSHAVVTDASERLENDEA
jgi:hypothetical protein